MYVSGGYRLTAAFDQAFKDGHISDRVLFFPQAIVMRGKCPSWEDDSLKPECEGLKDLVVAGEKVRLNLTTAHYATE